MYKENKNSVVTDNGIIYNVNKLVNASAKYRPVMTELSDFKLMITVGLEQIKDRSLDRKRVEKADFEYPIIYYENGKDLIVLDGMHRLLKSYFHHNNHGETEKILGKILAIKISKQDIKKCIISEQKMKNQS